MVEEGLGEDAVDKGIHEAYVINAQKCLNTIAKHFNFNV